jgi:hypothetical protein
MSILHYIILYLIKYYIIIDESYYNYRAAWGPWGHLSMHRPENNSISRSLLRRSPRLPTVPTLLHGCLSLQEGRQIFSQFNQLQLLTSSQVLIQREQIVKIVNAILSDPDMYIRNSVFYYSYAARGRS